MAPRLPSFSLLFTFLTVLAVTRLAPAASVEDVALIKHVHHLLYTEGYTIKGVQKLLKGQGKQQIISAPSVTAMSEPKVAPVAREEAQAVLVAGLSERQKAGLAAVLDELKELRALVQEAA